MLTHEQVKELKDEMKKLRKTVIEPYYEQKILMKMEYKLKRATQKSNTRQDRERYEDITQMLAANKARNKSVIRQLENATPSTTHGVFIVHGSESEE
jgi:hypothetical protein